ncbi:hypothetical protein P43SY_002120 [Pythium insidiosum]|uniref:Uncharacterized protein n=1 Tax=Pythium insidiosum TaxID=114742 RepID=A0AAD5LP27_PYTIN|nr:hypothetical protein P43SY_002120 [Pythium insidiosum]
MYRGEGTSSDRAIDDIPIDVVITDKRIFEEASTEIELLVENPEVTKVLLQAIETYRKLELSPATDPLRRWYDLPWRKDKPMPKFVEVPADEVPRFQVAVLRTSIRCLRLMMLCSDGKKLLEELNGPEVLNRAVLENPLDDYVKNDVKAIFLAVYGGDNAVKRIAIGNVPIVVEMISENKESAIVQLAGVQRICQLLTDVDVLMYTPEAGSPTHARQKLLGKGDQDEAVATADAPGSDNSTHRDAAVLRAERQKLFDDLETFGVVQMLTETLNRFDETKYLSLYVHVCRFISFVAIEERNAKLVGQCGGIEGSIRLLFKAREMQRAKRAAERAELERQAKLKAMGANDDWTGILDKPVANTNEAPPAPINNDEVVTNLASLAVVDFTPTEIGQLAIWALDLLATLDFNVSMMKLHKLKFLLEEIRLDPDSKELGSALIITRRLRLIRWDEIGLPPPSKTIQRI